MSDSELPTGYVDLTKDPEYQLSLRKGDIVHRNGIPIQLLADTLFFCHPDNQKLIDDMDRGPQSFPRNNFMP